MYYYTYKVVLLKGSLAGKYYYGQHRTLNLEDGYIGSGKLLASYFKTYPRVEGVTYVRQILAFYSDENELNRAEEELIGELYKTDPQCLNLKAGGIQGKYSKEVVERRAQALRGQAHPWNKGKKHTSLSCESKKKISETLKSKPPRRWVNDGVKSSLVYEKDLPDWLSRGYVQGRI